MYAELKRKRKSLSFLFARTEKYGKIYVCMTYKGEKFMNPFITVVFGAAMGIIAMYIISNLYLKRDESRRKSHSRKITILLNEKCALVLKLCSENRTITETLVSEIENIVTESLAEGCIYQEDELEQNTIDSLLNFIDNLNKNEISPLQAIQIGRIYSCLKLFYNI